MTRLGASVNKSPSMTRQADAEGCDINVIMKRYEKTGMLPPFTEGFFGDVSEMGDFREVTHRVMQATEIFGQFPAAFRAAFGNDVGTFVNWATDPTNAEAVKAALAGAEEPPVPPAASAPPVEASGTP